MSSDAGDFIWREDHWLDTVRTTHHLFCSCGEWLKHLNHVLLMHHGPEWHGDLATKEDIASRGGDGPGEVTDAELLAVMDAFDAGGDDAIGEAQ